MMVMVPFLHSSRIIYVCCLLLLLLSKESQRGRGREWEEGEGENGKRESEGCPDGKEREGEGRKEVKMERKGGCMQRFGAKPHQMSVVFYCIRDFLPTGFVLS